MMDYKNAAQRDPSLQNCNVFLNQQLNAAMKDAQNDFSDFMRRVQTSLETEFVKVTFPVSKDLLAIRQLIVTYLTPPKL